MDDELTPMYMLRHLVATNPLKGRFIIDEARKSEKLAQVLQRDETREFYETLRNKIKELEQVIIEIKGEVRSSKSTIAISLAKYLVDNWNYYHKHRPIEFTVNHIYEDQATWLYDVKNAKEGEVFIVDEQRSEAYGSGKIRESEQLYDVLNICAKRCNSVFFLQPRKFMDRNGIFGLEILTKVKEIGTTICFLHDLTKTYAGYPEGFVTVKKLRDTDYIQAPRDTWSKYRQYNYAIRGARFDFWSRLEEEYEHEKDIRVKKVSKLAETTTYQVIKGIAKKISGDPRFFDCKNIDEKRFYVLNMIAEGKIMGLTKDEVDQVIGGVALIRDGIVK